jgi:hypothetical protein
MVEKSSSRAQVWTTVRYHSLSNSCTPTIVSRMPQFWSQGFCEQYPIIGVATWMDPLSGVSSPKRALSNVDLPHPTGPRIIVTVPRLAMKLIGLSVLVESAEGRTTSFETVMTSSGRLLDLLLVSAKSAAFSPSSGFFSSDERALDVKDLGSSNPLARRNTWILPMQPEAAAAWGRDWRSDIAGDVTSVTIARDVKA